MLSSAEKNNVRHLRRRNAEESRESILAAGLEEFAERGLDGARIDQLAKRAGINIRMIYHYFGSKDGLYTAVVERAFLQLREREKELDLVHSTPWGAIVRLTDFTFDFFNDNPRIVRLFALENLHRAAHLQQSQSVPALSTSLIDAIGQILARGEKDGAFRRGCDPVQLYVSMVALSCFHVSNGPTLSTIFRRELAGPDWIKARRAHMREMVFRYLTEASLPACCVAADPMSELEWPASTGTAVVAQS